MREEHQAINSDRLAKVVRVSIVWLTCLCTVILATCNVVDKRAGERNGLGKIVYDGQYLHQEIGPYDVDTDDTVSITRKEVDAFARFASTPIVSLKFESGSSGCFHEFRNNVNYLRDADSSLKTVEVKINEIDHSVTSEFSNVVFDSDLRRALESINQETASMPSITSFNISLSDETEFARAFERQVMKQLWDDNDRLKMRIQTISRQVLATRDRLSPGVLQVILSRLHRMVSTTHNWIAMQAINESGDTVIVFRNYCQTIPWYLPLRIQYHGKTFACYSIELSRFIRSCVPSKFFGNEAFDNKVLLLAIADYYYELKYGTETGFLNMLQ